MLLSLSLGVLLAATSPDALEAVARCKLPPFLGATERGTAEFVDLAGTRTVHFHEEKPDADSFSNVTLREWFIAPGTCRLLALQQNRMESHPSGGARVLHVARQPPTEQERGALLAWLKAERRDPQRPDHQAASVPVLGVPPYAPPPRAPRGARRPPPPASPFTFWSWTQPPANWLAGPPVAQGRTWRESDFPAEKAVSENPKGFVSSGRLYSTSFGDCCIHEKEIKTLGSARLHFLASDSTPMFRHTYVVLEQPERRRTAWIISATHGLRLLGEHQGRAWLEQPSPLSAEFSLLALDLDSGALWHLGLHQSSQFNPTGYQASQLTEQGLLLKDAAGGAKRADTVIPWARLEQALREATPPEP